MIRISHYISILLLVVAAALLVPATSAFAQSAPVNDQYGNPTDADSDTPDEVEATPVAVANSESAADTGSLPLTGAELSLLAIAGGMLLTSGFVLRRVGAGSRREARRSSEPAA